MKELDVLESRAEAELRKGNAPTGAGPRTNTGRPSNVSTGYKTFSDSSSYVEDDEDDDPFAAVGTGGFFY